MEIHKLSNNDYFIYSNQRVYINTSNIDQNYLYINGKKSVTISEVGGLKDITPFNNSIYLYYNPPYNGSDFLGSIDASVDGTIKRINFFGGSEMDVHANMKYQKNIDDMSYMLLRANPKLTGNIKVVVDSKSDLYLDTFKVSEGLSQEKYRKIKINPNEYYGRTLMAKLKGLPSTDLYKIEDGCYEMFSTCSSLEEQYYDKYNCGVRTNTDKLYSENFSILAPLRIKKILPDFFLVFKVKNTTEIPGMPMNFNTDIDARDAERMNYFLSHGEIVKVFDMREGTPLGKYIRNIYNNAKEYIGDMYVSYDYDSYNTYNGISLERGVVSKIYESAAQEKRIKNQVAMNDWYTLGFERNRIVSKDIINFEFMFDDTSEKLFSLNTYFGLYVKVNKEDEDFSVVTMTGSSVFDTPIKLSKNFDPSTESNKSVIYGLTTPETFIRLDKNICGPDTSTLMEPYLLKPHKCLDVATTGNNYTYNESSNKTHAFVSFILKKHLLPGEIFRVVTNNIAGSREIFQVICSNKIDENPMSEVLTDTDSFAQITIKRHSISLYNIPYESDDTDELISTHIKLLHDAFEKLFAIAAFTTKTNILSDNALSIEIFDDDEYVWTSYRIFMQKFMSNSGFNETSVNIKTDDRIAFFGIDNIPTIEVTPGEQEYFYPRGFESTGNRVSTTVDFCTKNFTCVDHDPTSKISSYKSVIYPVNDTEHPDEVKYSMLNEQCIYYYEEKYDAWIEETPLYLRCMLGYDPKYPYVISIPGYEFDKVYLYQNYPLNAGVCSILPVKDFYTDVIDAYDRISINTNDGNINKSAGEYQSLNNAFDTSIAYGQEESICDYLDKNETFKYPFLYNELDYTARSQFRYVETDASIYEYFQRNIAGNHTKSDISLVSPYCCKWQSLGTDAVGKFSKIMYSFRANIEAERNSALFGQYVSYFIPNDNDEYLSDPMTPIYLNITDEVIPIRFDNNIGYVANESNYLPINSRFDNNSECNDDSFAWELFGDSGQIMEQIDDYVHLKLRNNGVWSNPQNAVKLKDTYKDIIFYDDYVYDVTLEIRLSQNSNLRKNFMYFIQAFGKTFTLAIREGDDSQWAKLGIKFTYSDARDLSIFFITTAEQYIDIDVKNISIHKSASNYTDDVNSVFTLDYASQKIINGNLSYQNHKDYRDYIINGTGSIDDILYTSYSNQPKFSKVSAISDNIIEFISAGLKFRISSNHTSIINMSNYNGYSAIFVYMDGNSPDNTSPCEIIIDETSQEIVFIVYTGIALSHIEANNNSTEYEYSQLYHTSQFADTWKVSDGADNMLRIPDDASLYTRYMYYGRIYDYTLFQHSPIMDTMSYSPDIDCFSASRLINEHSPYYEYNNDVLRYYISTFFDDAEVYVDSDSFIFETSNFPKTTEELIKRKYVNNCFMHSNGSYLDRREFETKWTLSQFKSFMHNCSLIVKTKTGVNNYTVDDNMINIEIIDPIYFSRFVGNSSEATSSGYTHPTFAEPIMKDMFTFNFDNSSIENTGNVSCKGCNLKIDDVRYLYQVWLRKYRPVDMSLQLNDSSTNKISSLSLKHNMSITSSCWDQNMFRIYNSADDYVEQNGIQTGYEKNTFFGSRGMTLKTSEDSSIISYITVNSWDYEIVNNNIEIDITNSVINAIMNEEGFISNWAGISSDNNINRKRYIQNSIINKYIDIQNAFESKRFVVKCDYKTDVLKLEPDINSSDADIVNNIDNELTFKNSVYKMILKNVDKHTYYVSINIPTK